MSEVARSPSVAVIGGGIIGLSIAWRLARGGARVELFERGALAGEASRVAAGMIAPVSEADPAESLLLELGLASAARWPSFAEELEADSEVRPTSLLDRTGTLLVARDADENRWLEREARVRRDQQLECFLLTPREARRLEPDLAPGLRGALHVPADHAVDPRAVAVALELAARGVGAKLHEHAPAIDGIDDPRLAGFDRVVIASGAWPVPGTSEAAATHPVKGQLLILRDPEHARREEPIARHVLRAQTVYCVPRGDGRYVIGATMEHRGEDRTVTAWAIHDLLRELFEILPAAREFVLDEALAGLRPATTSGDRSSARRPAIPRATRRACSTPSATTAAACSWRRRPPTGSRRWFSAAERSSQAGTDHTCPFRCAPLRRVAGSNRHVQGGNHAPSASLESRRPGHGRRTRSRRDRFAGRG